MDYKKRITILLLGSIVVYILLLHETVMKKFSSENSRSYKLYFVNAYLISNTTIRVTLLTKCNYFPKLALKIGDSASMSIKLWKVGTCPFSWYRSCRWGGQYGNAQLPDISLAESVLSGRNVLTVSYAEKPNEKKELLLIDSRTDPKKQKKHRIAVCPFPVIFMAEWTILAQFMEMWVEHGATKFYFYFQTVSEEFDALLRIYESDPKLDIERVHWGIMPIDEGATEDEDPNKQIIRGDEIFAATECALRSRGVSDYTVMSDFDETFIVFGNKTLLSVLDELLKSKPNTGAFMFRSTVAGFKNTWINATHPDQLNFVIFNNISVEKRTLPARQMSKLIVIPERMIRQHVHFVVQFENKMYHTHVVDPKISKMYHMRLIRWYGAKEKLASPSNDLQKHAQVWNDSYFGRLNDEWNRLNETHETFGLSLEDKVWGNKGMQVMKEVNRCYENLKKNSGRKCPTRFRCLDRLPSMNKTEWVFAEQAWIVL